MDPLAPNRILVRSSPDSCRELGTDCHSQCHERDRALQLSIRSPHQRMQTVLEQPVSALRKVVKGCGILNQDAVTQFLIGYPVREQIEQQRVVG